MGFQVPLLIYRRVHCTISDSCLPLNSEMKKKSTTVIIRFTWSRFTVSRVIRFIGGKTIPPISNAIGIQAIAKIVSLRHPTTFKQPLLFRLRLNSSIGRRSFRISSFSPDISKSSQPPTGRSSHR